MKTITLGLAALCAVLWAAPGFGQGLVVSDEYEPTSTELLATDVSGVRLGMPIAEVRALNTNLVETSQETSRKDIDTQVQEFLILEASALLHGPTHVWPGWSTVRIWLTRPEHGNKVCSMSFAKDLTSFPDLKELEGRLTKKYGKWCRKKVSKSDTGALTVRFTWGNYDRQQDRFVGREPYLDVWVHPSKTESAYKVTFNMIDPRLRSENTAAVEAAIDQLKAKAVHEIPF